MKKIMSKLVVSMLALSILTGCAENANKATSAPDNSSSSAQESVGADSSSQTLLVSIASGGRTLDPSAATDASSATFVNAAYDQLVTFGYIEKDGHKIANPEDIQPMLAKSWDVSEDKLEYILHLDENAKFANGDKVDADSVIFSLERVKNSNTSSFLFALTNITEMEKSDENTVILHLSKPSTILFKLLQMHILSIVNPKQLEGIDNVDEYLANNTVGSGAFNIDKWEPSSEAILTAREDYWRGAAEVKTVKISFIPESANRVLLAEKGDIDITMDIPPKDLDVLKGNSILDIVTYDSNGIAYLLMNTTKAPFDNLKVREALSYAVPYEDIIKDVMASKAKRLNHVVPTAMPGSLNEPSIYKYDLEKAKALLKEAGLESGFNFTLVVSNGRQEWMDTAILIQAELSKLNITVSIERMERPQYLEAVKAKNIEAAIGTYTAFVNDPGYLFGNTLHSMGEYNYASYNSEEVDSLWEKAESETDIEKRYDYLKEAQKIVENDAPWINLYENESTVIFNKNIKDFVYFPDASLRFYSVKK